MFSTEGKRRCAMACLGTGAVTGLLLFLFLWVGNVGIGSALLTGLIVGVCIAAVFFLLFCRGVGVAYQPAAPIATTAPAAVTSHAPVAATAAPAPAPAAADDDAEAERANAAAAAEMAAAAEVEEVNHDASEAAMANEAAAAEMAAANEVEETNQFAEEAKAANAAAAAEMAAAEKVVDANEAAAETAAVAAGEIVPEPVPAPAPETKSKLAADAAAGMTKPAALDGPRGGKADNLKEIKGVGPKMEKLLNSLGFYHFDQIAAWSPSEVAWVDEHLEGFRGRVTRDDWVAQSKILASGGETAFSKRVDDGSVY